MQTVQCFQVLPLPRTYSGEVIAVLTDIVGHHELVNDRRSDAKMVARKTEAWEEIAKAFNATGRPNYLSIIYSTILSTNKLVVIEESGVIVIVVVVLFVCRVIRRLLLIQYCLPTCGVIETLLQFYMLW